MGRDGKEEGRDNIMKTKSENEREGRERENTNMNEVDMA